MRIFKGLENIHSVIDKHQAEWLREHGEEPERPKAPSIQDRIRKLNEALPLNFGAGRTAEPEPANEPSVEVVNVIKQKDNSPHSWLYNEVVKAIHDAAGDGRNTKVVAIFIPVIQNGKEFEDLPVSETVTLSTVDEGEFNPEPIVESEPAEPEPTLEPEPIPEPATESIPEPEPEALEPEPAETEPIPEPEPTADDYNLIPEGQEEPDAELAEAFQTIEDNLDVSEPESEPTSAEPEPLPEPEAVIPEPELEPIPEPADDENEAVSEGEPLAFDEIALPDELDDDEVVFDDAVFEEPIEMVQIQEDEPEETIIIEESDSPDDDIELLPDPEPR